MVCFAFRLPTTHLLRGSDVFEPTSDYGPFAAIVGYAGAIMASGAAIFFCWGGKMEKWRPPEEDLPGTGRAVILLLCGLIVVLQWYFATPQTVIWLLAFAVVFAVACVISFLQYNSLLGTHVYTKVVATGSSSTRNLRILGGRKLLPEAEKIRQKNNITIQTLLQGAAYNVDLLWSRESRQWVKQRVLLLFILTLVFGTTALSGASIATQVVVTQKAAAIAIQNTN